MIAEILDLGITLILFLQNLGSWLLTPMKLFTFLGNEEFFLFVAPALYWCIDAALGLRLGLLLMISNGLNAFLKLVFHDPRPYWYDRRVLALTSETSFGVPSGHSQNAMVVWGLIAAVARRKWAWPAAIFVTFMIGLSRVYLGVHFPSDVLLGWTAGALLLWAFLALEKPVLRWLNRFRTYEKIAISFLGSMVLVLAGLTGKMILGAWTVPDLWVQNALLTFPGSDPINPISLSGLVSNAGTFFGLAFGAILMAQNGGFNTQGVWWKRFLRIPVGLIGVDVFWMGLGAVFPDGEHLLAFSLRYLRYALVGFWITALAPWVFLRLGLAESKSAAPPELAIVE